MALEDSLRAGRAGECGEERDDARSAPERADADGDVPPSTRVLPCPHNRQRYTPNDPLTNRSTYLTMTWPFIPAWSVQLYEKFPLLVNVRLSWEPDVLLIFAGAPAVPPNVTL